MKKTKSAKNKTTYYVLGGVLLAILVAYFVLADNTPSNNLPINNTNVETNIPNPPDDSDTSTIPPKVLLSVPFTSQAPFGEWSDPRQQDGCEEASILMAAKWAKGEKIASAQAAKDEILALSAKAQEMFGAFADSSAADTWKLYQAYYGLKKGRVVDSPTELEIKKELAKGNLVLVPADGRKLNNPNFSGGGPDRHFLAIIGYDENTKRFTTNDPGTRKGAGFQYTYANLMESLHDYPTGDHLDTFKNDTAMIVIEKA